MKSRKTARLLISLLLTLTCLVGLFPFAAFADDIIIEEGEVVSDDLFVLFHIGEGAEDHLEA